MARAIDGDALKQWCEKIIDQACHPATVQIGEVFLDKVRSMPTLTPPNEPLTIEELREMDEEPVYVHNLFPAKRKFEWQWALVCKERGNAEATTYTYRFLDYGKTWIAYRRPKEEQ